MKVNWKTIAIILVILFCLENAFLAYSYYYSIKEDKRIKQCYYDLCSEYPEAYFVDDICYCYNYDQLGYLIQEETFIINTLLP